MANTTSLLCVPLLLTLSLISPSSTAAFFRRSLRLDPITTASQFLNSHNSVRAKHRLPPLKWSRVLASYARWHAGQHRSDCALVHSSASYGENIFWGSGKRWTPTQAVGAWAEQEAYFNYDTNSCNTGKVCLHYTQMVWRSTKSVGCAMIKCGTGDTYVVCEYHPYGNVIGQKPY